MSKTNNKLGLGEPEIIGKQALFQAPERKQKTGKGTADSNKPGSAQKQKSLPRFKTTILLSGEALFVIKNIQQQHRMETGKFLPLWQVVSDAMIAYGKKEEGR